MGSISTRLNPRQDYIQLAPLRIATISLLTVATPSAAHAHLVSTGMGPLMDGITHAYLSPEQIAVTVAVAIFSGLGDKAAARLGLMSYPPAFVAGAAFGVLLPGEVSSSWLISVALIGFGLLIALGLTPRPKLVAVLGALAGLFQGTVLGSGLRGVSDGSTFLLGNLIAVGVTMFILSALVISAKAGWQKIAVRTVGAWLVAAGILMLGWVIRNGV